MEGEVRDVSAISSLTSSFLPQGPVVNIADFRCQLNMLSMFNLKRDTVSMLGWHTVAWCRC